MVGICIILESHCHIDMDLNGSWPLSVAYSGVQELFVRKKHLGIQRSMAWGAVPKAIGKHRACRLQWKGAWQVWRLPVAQVAVEKIRFWHVLALYFSEAPDASSNYMQLPHFETFWSVFSSFCGQGGVEWRFLAALAVPLRAWKGDFLELAGSFSHDFGI